MSIIGSNLLAGASGQGGAYEIERSLRFNDGDSAWLSKTFAGDGNLTTWTWSGWVKRSGGLGAIQHLFGWISLIGGDNFQHVLGFDANNKLYFLQYNSILGAYLHNQTTEPVYRDVSAWYHVVAVYDTDNTTLGDRIRLYVNGERITSFSSDTTPTSGREGYINDASYEHGIGRAGGNYTSGYFDGYMTEVNFIDGTALDASDFGETDTETGAWIPKKYSGSYGTNGFYLNFSDNSSVSALGTDSSVNGNNWTPTNFSVTAGAGNDSLEDTPTNNWCTLNPIAPNGCTFSNGNLSVTTPVNGVSAVATFSLPTSGKWYWEYVPTSNGGIAFCGIVKPLSLATYITYYASTGEKYVSGSASSYGATYGNNDVIGVAVNVDSNELTFYKNGTSQGTITGNTLDTGDYSPWISDGSSSASASFDVNFGQRAFAYTPPAGYKALNTANLPVPTIKDGTNHFDTLIYTGNATARSITGLNFAPDFVWHKARSAADDHRLMDSVRAGGTDLSSAISFSNLTDAEASLTGQLTQTSNGFDLVATTNFNNSGRTFVAWNWKAGGSSSSNTDGSITGTVSANVDAGFSIVSYTSNGTSGATLGHGLGASPGMIIVKMRTDQSVGTDNWAVFHKSLGATKNLWLDASNSQNTSAAYWNDTEPTSSVFSLGNDLDVNHSNGYAYIAYCFAEVEGYSKFGSYTGNGSANGPFVSCGFRPSLILLKSSTAGESWEIMDNKRDVYNGNTGELRPNLSSAETTSNQIDFLSNGFKIRTLAGQWNTSGQTYIFMALAENPFKYANAR